MDTHRRSHQHQFLLLLWLLVATCCVAQLPTLALAQSATAQQHYGGGWGGGSSSSSQQASCGSRIVRVSCFYDSTQTALAGLRLVTEGSAVQSSCRTGIGRKSHTHTVPDGTGIQAVAVTSTKGSGRVVRMEFRLSNGQQFACAAPKHNPWVSYGGRRLAQSLEAPPAAAESSAAVAAIGSSDSSSGSSDAAAVADLWSAANTTETEVVVLDSFVADGESAPDSNTPAGAAVAQHSGWGKWGSKVHGGGSSGSNGGSSGAGSWGSWSSVSTQSVLMTGRPPAGAGASSVMWLAGMSGGCSSTSSWRSSSKSLTAPLAGCWVPADAAPGGEAVVFDSVQGSTVDAATVTEIGYDAAGHLISGRITRGTLQSGWTSTGVYLVGGTVTSARIMSATVTGGQQTGGTLTNARLEFSDLRAVSVEDPQISATPPPSPSPPAPSPPPPSPPSPEEPSPSPSPPEIESPSPSPQPPVASPSPSPSPSVPPPPPPSPSPQPPVASPSPSPKPPSPSPLPPSPSPSPKPSPSPSPSPKPSPSPTPSPSPSPKPSPSPSPSPTPSPSPRPPSPYPSPAPSPQPSPQPPSSPSPSSPPPSLGDNTLAVSLFARGQTSCGSGPSLPDAAAASLTSYLSSQLMLLQMPGFRVALNPGSCMCATDASQQSVPHWSCVYTVSSTSGGGTAAASPAAVANYLAKSLTAGGQEFCAAQPSASGFCDATLGITGFCATTPASGSSFCKLTPILPPSSSQSWTMTTTVASPGKDCPASGRVMSAASRADLITYLTGFMPGFQVTLPQASKAMQCVQQYGNAYYGIPVLVSPKAMLDTQGAAEHTAAQLQALQRLPCINTTTGVAAPTPAFCTEFATPALCGSPRYSFSADGSSVLQCTAAGSSMLLNVLNPGVQGCTAGVPPPAQYAVDLTTWLKEQMVIIAGNKWKGTVAEAMQSDATQRPTKISGADHCKFIYRVMITGPLTTTPEQLTDLGISMMGNALGLNSAYKDVTCDAYEQMLPFCSYWPKAKMCSAYPWSELQPYTCDFE